MRPVPLDGYVANLWTLKWFIKSRFLFSLFRFSITAVIAIRCISCLYTLYISEDLKQ